MQQTPTSPINSPADPITPIEVSIIVLHEIETQLHLAGDELQRMEDEGGQNQTREQAAKANDYLKASNRIKVIVPLVEEINAAAETPQSDYK